MGAMVIIGLIDNFVRLIAADGGLWQFHFIRALICCALVLAYCFYRRRPIRPKRYRAVLTRSLCMASAIVLYFGGLSLMPISVAGATLFSSPIFVLVFATLIFRTRVGPWRIVAVGLGFVGMLLVLDPDVENLDIFFVPLLAGICYAMGQLTTHHLCADENTETLLVFFFVTIGLFGLVGMIVLSFVTPSDSLMRDAPFFVTGWTTPTWNFLLWTSVQAIGSTIAVAGLIRGYQVADPTFIAVFEYSFLIFAGFWAWLLWSELPGMQAVVGIAAIMAAGILISVRSRRKQV